MVAEIVFYILLFLLAILFSSVGHGGASGYLALMALYSFPSESMRSNALLLNILVSLISFIHFYRKGYFNWNLFWPFIVLSIPAAYIGGTMTLEGSLYKKILAMLLIVAALRMVLKNNSIDEIRKQNKIIAILTGGLIGFVSGVIGIGGGIILSPLVLLFKWADIKTTAALSSLFILVNSVSGVAGIATNGLHASSDIILMLAITIVAAFIGSYLGTKKLNTYTLNNILAGVLIIAAIKLYLT
jgi:hypothetical protein